MQIFILIIKFLNHNLYGINNSEKINQQDEEIKFYNEFVDGKEVINWNRLIIFTIFDIIN